MLLQGWTLCGQAAHCPLPPPLLPSLQRLAIHLPSLAQTKRPHRDKLKQNRNQEPSSSPNLDAVTRYVYNLIPKHPTTHTKTTGSKDSRTPCVARSASATQFLVNATRRTRTPIPLARRSKSPPLRARRSEVRVNQPTPRSEKSATGEWRYV